MIRANLLNIGRVLLLLISISSLKAQLVHPGISHNMADLERMKAQVEAGVEPWLSSYNKLKSERNASYDYTIAGDPSNTVIVSHSQFIGDGYAAYHNALMWYITGDERHAQKSIEIFTAWSNIRRIEDQFALNNGRGPWKMCEAAEIIRSTYSGWSQNDIDNFKEMLVYPGWSGTQAPTPAIASKDVSFYWNIYQGDRARHGNQGLFGYRSLMAMAIFLDNEIMYDRALRYLQGLPHRSDDLAYPEGPPSTTPLTTGNEFYDEFQIRSWGDEEDYGYNEVMSNYIYENGQCQESSRDQTHSTVGIAIINCISEMAWNQGDDLYGHLDNRQLLGLEFTLRYNASWEHSYPDQPTPWEPTVETGEYIVRTDRSGRWRSLKVNPFVAANIEPENFERGTNLSMPVYEIMLGHYRDRMMLPSENYKWLERGHAILQEDKGVEDGMNAVDYHGYGGLKFRRVSPGDPISGFDANGLPIYSMNVLPMTIEAENYDYFTTNGQGKTYNDATSTNADGLYRPDESVDIQTCTESGCGYYIGRTKPEEWLTYTVYVPETRTYDIALKIGSLTGGGQVQFLFDGEDKTGIISLPTTGGWTSWEDYTGVEGLLLEKGVHSVKLLISEGSGAYTIDNFTISESSRCVSPYSVNDNLFNEGVDYKYYNGEWDFLPAFESLTEDASGEASSISLGAYSGQIANAFAYDFTGYIKLPSEGTYTLYTRSDDGSKLYIDDVLLVNNDGTHGVEEKSESICLQAGYHKIRVSYFDKSGGKSLSASYEGPGVSKRNLDNLYVLSSDPCVVNPPVTPTILSSGTTTFCEGENVQLTATTGASSYVWRNGTTTLTTPTSLLNVTESGNYSVEITDKNGCSASSESTEVTVNELPEALSLQLFV